MSHFERIEILLVDGGTSQANQSVGCLGGGNHHSDLATVANPSQHHRRPSPHPIALCGQKWVIIGEVVASLVFQTQSDNVVLLLTHTHNNLLL